MRVRPNETGLQSPYLSSGREYYVIGLDHESFRIVDDDGEPVLFPRDHFEIIDDLIPSDWIWDRYSDDEYYANPPELHTRRFYEDYFDRKKEAINRFEFYLKKMGTEPEIKRFESYLKKMGIEPE